MKSNKLVLAGLVAVVLALVGLAGAPPSRAGLIQRTEVVRASQQSPAPLTWDLAEDFRVSPDQANPNPDSYGNAGVWSFLRSTTTHDPTTFVLLTQFLTNIVDTPGLEGWIGPEATGYPNDGVPTVQMNTTGEPLFIANTAHPPGVIITHPDSAQPAIVGWKSPAKGTISIGGGVTDLCDLYGDGILWYIDKNSSTVASGSYANGGAQLFQDGTNGNQLGNIPVKKGDEIYFLVAPGGDYYCDGTQLDATIEAKVCTKTPKGLEPVDGAKVSGPAVQLTWNAAACAGTYRVRITQVGNGKPVVNEKALVNPSYLFATGIAGHRYDWQVRACNMGTCGPWTTPQRFHIAP